MLSPTKSYPSTPQRPSRHPYHNRAQLRAIGTAWRGKDHHLPEPAQRSRRSSLRCLYVITNNPVSLIKEQIRAMGLAPGRADQIIYVDMYRGFLRTLPGKIPDRQRIRRRISQRRIVKCRRDSRRPILCCLRLTIKLSSPTIPKNFPYVS